MKAVVGNTGETVEVEQMIDDNTGSTYFIPVDVADDDFQQWEPIELDIDYRTSERPVMTQVLIFEQSHLDGFSGKRIDAYIPVSSYAVGDRLIEETLKRQFSSPRYVIDRPDEHTAVVTLSEKYKSGIEMFDNCILSVVEMQPVTMEKIEKKLAEPVKKEPEEYTEPNIKYNINYDFEWQLERRR